MDWKSVYKERLTTAEEAVRKIPSGARVAISLGAGEPGCLTDAMVRNKEWYSDVEFVHMLPMGKMEYCAPGMEKHFRLNTLFAGGKTRETISSGHGDYTPCFFSQVPGLFQTTLPLDVALVHVSLPDEHGYCSLGISIDYSKRAAESAKMVIAQVNEHMPRTLGDTFLHVSDMDAIVEHHVPLTELPPPVITDVEKAIGEHCARLIRDGDTLQLGIGAIPDAVLLFLHDKKDLGVHSEMLSDGIVGMVQRGVVNNSRKTLHPGKMVVTFLMGTRKLYDFVHNNPSVVMYPVDYVNNPQVIAQNDNLVSINSCVQVDFLGQVVADTIGPMQISGVGGQVDFVRGAAMSKGGKSIIAMPSTAAKGKVSRIVPMIDTGSAVTTSRNDVDYVITEYGTAALKGYTVRERARRLIGIAHPDFRAELVAEFERRFNCVF